jgi:hypothetical protein
VEERLHLAAIAITNQSIEIVLIVFQQGSHELLSYLQLVNFLYSRLKAVPATISIRESPVK